MSQQGEIPAESAVLRAAPVQPPPPGIQVQAPPQLQSQPQPQPDASSAKRRREEGDGAAAGETGESAPKRQAKVQDVIFRIVVPSRQIGKVIGKAGHRIQKIREATRATIKIADAIARHEERVIIISSKDNEEMVSDAENALQQIAALILTEDDIPAMAPPVGIVGAVGAFAALGTVGPFGAVGAPGTTGTIGATGAVGAGHVAANTIRLLIAGSQAGSLIGMSGQNIEKLRSSSGATITILAPNQLPLCASAHDSDRVVQLSGDVPAVLKALTEIGHQLRENPPKQVISISPAYNYSLIRPAQPYVDPTSGQPILQLIMLRSR